MQSYILKPDQPKVARFVGAMRREWRTHKRWLAVYKFLENAPGELEAAVKHVSKTTGLGSRTTLLNAYDYVEKMLQDANDQSILGDFDEELAPIGSRDLVPTRYLHLIFTAFDKSN